MPKIIENNVIEEFKDRDSFSREELFDFFRCFEPDLKEGTFGWRIYDLKSKNIIKPLQRGVYVVSYKPGYQPDISSELLDLAGIIAERFEDVKSCLWETDWINEFSQHQASRRIILIEVEKEFVESLYYELKDRSIQDLYLNPDAKVIDLYVSESVNPVIIKNLITRSPIGRRTKNSVKFFTPLMEKILVDLFAEEKLFYFYRGSELIHIYENVLKNYTINFTKMFGYARRRSREHEIKAFMTNHLAELVQDIIDD